VGDVKTRQAAQTTYPLVRKCLKVLNAISTGQTVELFWVPGHAGVRGNEIAYKLARDGSVKQFVGPGPSLGVAKQNIRRKIKLWVANQHLARWRGRGITQRQARALISGPSPTAMSRFLFFNRTHYRVVIDLLTGHNTLGEHLHLMGLTNSLFGSRCGEEEETSAHILCECAALTSLRHAYLWLLFLGPRGN
jgi:hypothetical protein